MAVKRLIDERRRIEGFLARTDHEIIKAVEALVKGKGDARVDALIAEREDARERLQSASRKAPGSEPA